jgi:hypothetical protein
LSATGNRLRKIGLRFVPLLGFNLNKVVYLFVATIKTTHRSPRP